MTRRQFAMWKKVISTKGAMLMTRARTLVACDNAKKVRGMRADGAAKLSSPTSPRVSSSNSFLPSHSTFFNHSHRDRTRHQRNLFSSTLSSKERILLRTTNSTSPQDEARMQDRPARATRQGEADTEVGTELVRDWDGRGSPAAEEVQAEEEVPAAEGS